MADRKLRFRLGRPAFDCQGKRFQKSPRAADQKEGGRWLATAKARSRAMPTRPRVPSSKRRPIRVMPWGSRRGEENFGSGFFGSGAQSERASETSTKPARRVSEG